MKILYKMDNDLNDVSQEIMETTLAEINENADTVEEDIEQFRQLVSKEEGLISRLDRIFLLRFLRARKFNQERALELLRNYYKAQSKYPEIMKMLKPSELKRCYCCNVQCVLDGRDNLGRRIRAARLEHWDPHTLNFDEIIACSLMDMEICAEEEATQICGINALFDFKGLTWYQMTYCTITNFRKLFNLLERSLPARIKVLNIINESFIARTLLAIVKTFMSKKMRDRIQIHSSDFSGLHKQIHPSILPSEFGGQLPPMDATKHIKDLEKYEEFFCSFANYGYVEK